MPPRRLIGEAPTPEIPNYAEQLQVMAAEEGLPEDVLTERGINLAAKPLEIMREEHGDPTKDRYKHYHNDQHALNVIRRSWRLWKPLREALPDLFDEAAFELLMIAGAGHDIINDPEAARDHPGQNETDSAGLVYGMMLEAGYEDSAVARVFSAIKKTTVQRNEQGVIVQTEMRQGTPDIMGLILGQADMNGILIEGPATLISDASKIYLEFTKTSLKTGLRKPAGLANFFLNEEKYLRDRVAALSGDLQYYVEDEAQRARIVQIYHAEFSDASVRALELAGSLHQAAERTHQVVEGSLDAASRVAQRGMEQIVAMKRHLADQFKTTPKDLDE